MAPTKKEKSKTDLDQAIFRFKDKQEELTGLLGEPNDEETPSTGLVNATLHELSDKWEIVLSSYMNYVEIRGEEEEDRSAVEECTVRYKQLRDSFVKTKVKAAKAVELHGNAARGQGGSGGPSQAGPDRAAGHSFHQAGYRGGGVPGGAEHCQPAHRAVKGDCL